MNLLLFISLMTSCFFTPNEVFHAAGEQNMCITQKSLQVIHTFLTWLWISRNNSKVYYWTCLQYRLSFFSILKLTGKNFCLLLKPNKWISLEQNFSEKLKWKIVHYKINSFVQFIPGTFALRHFLEKSTFFKQVSTYGNVNLVAINRQLYLQNKMLLRSLSSSKLNRPIYSHTLTICFRYIIP